MLGTLHLAFAMPVCVCLRRECLCVCVILDLWMCIWFSWATLYSGKCMVLLGAERQLLAPPFSPYRGRGWWACEPTLCRVGTFILNPASLQWTHMFLLIEDQGAQGYELFFKTRELKKKWMEQFEMAM